MNINTKSICLLLVSLMVFACEKKSVNTTSATYCWQLIDPAGNKIKLICDKTAVDMQALYPDSCSY